MAGDFYDTGEPIAAFAWPLLIQLGGLARLAGSRLELSARGRATLASPSYEALAALWAPVAGERVERRAGPDRRHQGPAQARHADLGRHQARRRGRGPGRADARRVDRRRQGTRPAPGSAAAAGGDQEPAGAVAALRHRRLLRLARLRRPAGLGRRGGQVCAVRALRVRGDRSASSTSPTPGPAAHAAITRPCGGPTSSAACPATTAWPRSGSTSWAPPILHDPLALPGLGLPVPRRADRVT